MSETYFASLLCAFVLGADSEVTAKFPVVEHSEINRADCVTDEFAIEVGVDNSASARDSIHQAIFNAKILEKKPAIVIIDQDGREDKHQYEIKVVAQEVGIPFMVCSGHFLRRWRMTRAFRGMDDDLKTPDLPQAATAQSSCNLDALDMEAE